MSAARFAGGFLPEYARVLPRVAYRMTASLVVDPRGARRFVHDVLNGMASRLEDPVLGSCAVTDLLPGGEPVVLEGRFQLPSGSETRSLLELAVLGHVCRSLRPAVIFEIGTFIGRTTRLLAQNAGAQCRVVTLDLPRGAVAHDVGCEFAETPEAARIEQAEGDSSRFDFSPWRGRCDFVWVDGNHSYAFAEQDTRTALGLVRPGGWVGWHDYHPTSAWKGVTRAVRRHRAEFARIRHIRGTTIVLAQTSG